MPQYPHAIEALIEALKQLPGVGRKTAERYAFDTLSWDERSRTHLSEVLATLSEKVKTCSECGCLMDSEKCGFCTQAHRNQESLCVISSPKDAYAMEETHQFRGLYHVVGAPISPLDGRGPDALELDRLLQRVQELGVREVIIALDSTLEGDATTLYISKALGSLPCTVSRLASGIPMGSSLQYVDGGTLTQAFLGRHVFADS